MKILIIEDEVIIAKDLQLLLLQKIATVVDIAFDNKEALDLYKNHKYDLIISDINLHAEKDGIETVIELTKIYTTPVVFLTAYSDKETIKRAEAVIPFAYLLKPFNNNQLLLTIKLAFQNFQKNKQKPYKKNLKNDNLLNMLTSREKEVLVVLCSGKLIKEIADSLIISSRTVEKHIENIKSKLNLNTSRELIKFAMNTNMLSIDS